MPTEPQQHLHQHQRPAAKNRPDGLFADGKNTAKPMATVPRNSTLLGKRPFMALPQALLISLGHHLSKPFSIATQAFWENHINLHFVGVLPNAESYFLPEESLFVVAYPLPENPEVTLEVRLSESGCRWLLDTVLGQRGQDVIAGETDQQQSIGSVLDSLTQLESTILQRWCHKLFDGAGDVFDIPQDDEGKVASATTLDFIWLLANAGTDDGQNTQPLSDTGDYGKLILRAPRHYLRRFVEHYSNTPGGDDLTPLGLKPLKQALSTVVVTLGRSRLPLDELQQLERGDVVLLEASHISRLQFNLPGQTAKAGFEANIALPEKVINRFRLDMAMPEAAYDNHFTSYLTLPEATAMSATQLPPNNPQMGSSPFWSQLHIDVEAAFQPVRIPLADLQQLSEGLIMEVGDLTDNKINLHVDGKPIAHGELVIIGDKFGVRIQHVNANASEADELPPVVEGLHEADTNEQDEDSGEVLAAAADGGDEELANAPDSDGIPLATANEGDTAPVDSLDNDDDW
jgi:flagellar motor switch protein FliN/FliY